MTDDIAQTTFAKTAAKAKDEGTFLALEATCTLSLSHENLARAMLFHNVLLCSYDIEYNQVDILGLIDAQRCSGIKKVSKKNKNIPHDDRESIQWEQASKNMNKILGSDIGKIISICDRESGIYEYAQYKQSNNQRFIVRSVDRRKLEGGSERFHECRKLNRGSRQEVLITQKGGKKARISMVQLEYGKVEMYLSKDERGEKLTLNYVRCTEIGQNDNSVIWHLLTNERVESKKDAQLLALYYEKYWLIEEFHKAWKIGGTNIEGQILQSREEIDNLALILAFIAVRILQLRELGERWDGDSISCKSVLNDTEWQVLWLKTESDEIPNDFIPSMRWAYLALGKLGKRYPPKKNIRIGWQSLWNGYYVLEILITGYEIRNSR